MTSTFIVQIASVPGSQVGQRRFEQSRYLHELLLSLLTTEGETNADKEQITALKRIIPQHEVVLRSGFSQTARWGLEPNMFLQVGGGARSDELRRAISSLLPFQIHGDENQARMISALFGEAFCQDGIGIGGRGVAGQDHSVLIINRQWENEEERLKLISTILREYPGLSAQLDLNGQLAFHDYSMSAAFPDVGALLRASNREYFVEQRRVKSELVDRTDYSQLLMSLESANARRALHDLRDAHARLFSGYGCGGLLTGSNLSTRRRLKRREQRQDVTNASPRQASGPPHLCSLIFTSRRPCMCLTENSCFCHYTLVLTGASR